MNHQAHSQHRRRMLALAAAPAALLAATPAHAVLDWLAQRAAENRKTRYASVLDKVLVDALYVLEEDGKKEGVVPALRQAGYKLNGLNPDLLAMEKILGAYFSDRGRSFQSDRGR